ncbi:hypothetical protein Rsub_03327 [Raphidocelis subcapitata]|uniref:RING-type domain-containing protein n=1 Tax=Raphidocelis subcapitata TaxID=307507 RepID=A0A2V0NRC7_9CHLO|nr:hypothetical protein Rsub_03327 [Raphidocelis subcapitata]|eukprot:GBF90194.1 hypothetical protein Rsub_03327 [Raphidocelis subcapitata]
MASEGRVVCPLCYEVFVEPVATPCGHDFCLLCATAWLESRAHPHFLPGWAPCPCCRRGFSTHDLTPASELAGAAAARHPQEHAARAAALAPALERLACRRAAARRVRWLLPSATSDGTWCCDGLDDLEVAIFPGSGLVAIWGLLSWAAGAAVRVVSSTALQGAGAKDGTAGLDSSSSSGDSDGGGGGGDASTLGARAHGGSGGIDSPSALRALVA